MQCIRRVSLKSSTPSRRLLAFFLKIIGFTFYVGLLLAMLCLALNQSHSIYYLNLRLFSCWRGSHTCRHSCCCQRRSGHVLTRINISKQKSVMFTLLAYVGVLLWNAVDNNEFSDPSRTQEYFDFVEENIPLDSKILTDGQTAFVVPAIKKVESIYVVETFLKNISPATKQLPRYSTNSSEAEIKIRLKKSILILLW